MKGKYITWEIVMAVLTKPVFKKDIHAELQETIEERKRIMTQLQEFSSRARVIEMYLNTSHAA
jgi:hypothetical protein